MKTNHFLRRDCDHFRGCLLGGAIGDALGWPVEFMRLNEIKQKYGEAGISNLILGRNGKAEITDDTQMTLFTAEGLLRADSRYRQKGICHPSTMVYHAYLRWLYTQDYPKANEMDFIYNGWILQFRELYARRAPGNSCLSALMSGKQGSMEKPINNSKGCGGVMRMAPVGLFLPKRDAFKLACECAALTHGHPSGYLSAGAFAYIIACIIEGSELETAVNHALEELEKHENHEECEAAIQKAIESANESIGPAEAIKTLGEGWVGEEALAISIYCALKHKDDFKAAVCLAVNHDGDSDSTGAITGNILGAYWGIAKIPKEWIEKVELANVLVQVADDLLNGYQDTDKWRERYPCY